MLSNEEYGLEVVKIKGIYDQIEIKKVPNAPNFLKCMVKLDKKLVPVIDLRLKLGFVAADYTNKTPVISVNFMIYLKKFSYL